MTEHDNGNYPLFNSLPRLIDITLEKYRELQSQNETPFAAEDLALIAELEQWQRKVKRHQNPPVVKEILKEYRSLTA
jgi:hypothetical protein